MMQILKTKVQKRIGDTKLELFLLFCVSVKRVSENISRVSENRLLKRICEHNKEVTGGWRKLYKNKHHNFYGLPNIIRVKKSNTTKWRLQVAPVAHMRNAYKILVRKPIG
jgi:hypothetical protein